MGIKRSDIENLEQLALGLDLPDPEDQAGLSAEDRQKISMAAMAALEAADGSTADAVELGQNQPAAGSARTKCGPGAWFDDYLRLKGMGFQWRVAAYIAWEASPKRERWPETVTELATEVLGLKSPRVIYTWRKKNPAIDDVVSLMQSAPLFEHRRDVIEALIQVASDPDYKGHSDRKLFFEMIGDYVPRSKVDLNERSVDEDDLSGLSDAELRRMAKSLKEDDGSSPDGDELGEIATSGPSDPPRNDLKDGGEDA